MFERLQCFQTSQKAPQLFFFFLFGAAAQLTLHIFQKEIILRNAPLLFWTEFFHHQQVQSHTIKGPTKDDKWGVFSALPTAVSWEVFQWSTSESLSPQTNKQALQLFLAQAQVQMPSRNCYCSLNNQLSYELAKRGYNTACNWYILTQIYINILTQWHAENKIKNCKMRESNLVNLVNTYAQWHI